MVILFFISAFKFDFVCQFNIMGCGKVVGVNICRVIWFRVSQQQIKQEQVVVKSWRIHFLFPFLA